MVDLKKMQEELDDMEKALEEPQAGEDDIRTEAQSTESPSTQSSGTESPETEASSTEAPSTEAPEEDPRDATIRTLEERLSKLETPKPTSPPPTKTPSTDVPLAEEDFIGETDLDELTRDPKSFNKLLNDIYKKAVTDVRKEMRSNNAKLSQSFPDIARGVYNIQRTLNKIQKDFYKENPDLEPWKKSVSIVFDEMTKEDPDKSYEDILPNVADEVRKRVGITKSSTTSSNDLPPSLPKKKGGKRQTSNNEPDAFQKEMNEMDKALGLD